MIFSQFLFRFSLFFIIGIFLSSFFGQIGILIPGFFILGVILIVVFFFSENYKKREQKNPIYLVGLSLIALSIGFFWYFLCNDKKDNSFFLAYDETKEDLFLEGFIVDEPDLREKTEHLILKPTKINNKDIFECNEKILVIIDKYSEINYLDKVSVRGKITRPQSFNGFDYAGYLAKDSIYSIIFYPEIKSIGMKESFFSLKRGVIKFRNQARDIINKNLPSPHSSILGAMILGDKKRISQDWQEKLSVSGIRHITAVSGLHVAVLTIILTAFLFWVGLNKKFYFYFIMPAIFFFIFVSGMQPSAIRAGIMGGCILLSQFWGKMNNPFRLIILAAFLMLAFNPLLLKNDIGFQFSFLAIIGIIIFSSFFENIFSFLPKGIKKITALSFSAQILVFPLLGYYFGKVSLIFPLTNLLVIPIIYWIMIFGMTFIIFSLFSNFLSAIFLIPLWFLLTYLTIVVNFFSQLPWASIAFSEVIFILIIFYIILIFWLTWGRKEKNDKLFT